MLIDLHVHTNRYSKCSHMAPEDVAITALNAGLDGVVITEHGTIWKPEELEEFRQQFPDLLILRAFEVSAADRYDVLVYGIFTTEQFSRGMPAREVVDTAHALGGLAVLAHPLRYAKELSPEMMETPFDACETRSVNIDPLLHKGCDMLAVQLGVPAVHNSDGHDCISVGGYFNEFHVPIENETDLVAALRSHAFTPRENQSLVQPAMEYRMNKAEDRIRHYVAKGISDPATIWDKVGGSFDRVCAIMSAGS